MASTRAFLAMWDRMSTTPTRVTVPNPSKLEDWDNPSGMVQWIIGLWVKGSRAKGAVTFDKIGENGVWSGTFQGHPFKIVDPELAGVTSA